MSTPSSGPKVKRRRPRLVPLLMLGSDGETYACAPANGLPPDILKTPGVVVAIRLLPKERELALYCLQIGVVRASRTLVDILGRKFDA